MRKSHRLLFMVAMPWNWDRSVGMVAIVLFLSWSTFYHASPCWAQAAPPSVNDCLAGAGGLSDCLVALRVRPNAAGGFDPETVVAGSMTENDELQGKHIQLQLPPIVYEFTEGPSSGLVSDRVEFTGLTATLSSDPALDAPIPGVQQVTLNQESLINFEVAGFTFQDFPEGSDVSDMFTVNTSAGPRMAQFLESQEPASVTFTIDPIIYDFLEPGPPDTQQEVQDRLILSGFSVTFTSGDEQGLPPTSGAVQIMETPGLQQVVQNAVAVIAISAEGEVPEPAVCVLVAMALCALPLMRRK
jgi:hypothetical protein